MDRSEYCRKYYAANRERILANQKKWREANRERVQAYYKKWNDSQAGKEARKKYRKKLKETPTKSSAQRWVDRICSDLSPQDYQ
jgi:hypothetical protein